MVESFSSVRNANLLRKSGYLVGSGKKKSEPLVIPKVILFVNKTKTWATEGISHLDEINISHRPLAY